MKRISLCTILPCAILALGYITACNPLSVPGITGTDAPTDDASVADASDSSGGGSATVDSSGRKGGGGGKKGGGGGGGGHDNDDGKPDEEPPPDDDKPPTEPPPPVDCLVQPEGCFNNRIGYTVSEIDPLNDMQSLPREGFTTFTDYLIDLHKGTETKPYRIDLGFTFYFYNEPYTAVCVGSRGVLLFADEGKECDDLPNPGVQGSLLASPGEKPNNAFYPFWSDLEPATEHKDHFEAHYIITETCPQVLILQIDELSYTGDNQNTVGFTLNLTEGHVATDNVRGATLEIYIDDGHKPAGVPLSIAVESRKFDGAGTSATWVPYPFNANPTPTGLNRYTAEISTGDKLSKRAFRFAPAFEECCGNGKLNEGEQCDEGKDNSNHKNARCRPDCTIKQCGDGIVDSQCYCAEDGRRCPKHENDHDCGKSNCCDWHKDTKDEAPCTKVYEECDGGPNCSKECKLKCGDGYLDEAEQCDIEVPDCIRELINRKMKNDRCPTDEELASVSADLLEIEAEWGKSCGDHDGFRKWWEKLQYCRCCELQPGAFAITEFMSDPGDDAGTEEQYEWFEIKVRKDASDDGVNLRGISCADLGNDHFDVNNSIIVQQGSHFVFGRDAGAVQPLGIPVGFEYGAKMSLTNHEDEIYCYDRKNCSIIDAVVYDDGFIINNTHDNLQPLSLIQRNCWETALNAENHSTQVDLNCTRSQYDTVDANDDCNNWSKTSEEQQVNGLGVYATAGRDNEPAQDGATCTNGTGRDWEDEIDAIRDVCGINN